MKAPKNIILSRTDGVGDMTLMLPMAGILKEKFPGIKVAVIGKQYTKALVASSIYVDEFIDENDFLKHKILVCGQQPEVFVNVRTNKRDALRAKKLRIPIRIGTSSRLYHWRSCNKLVKLHRKQSHLHEAQLNIKLLQPLGITEAYSLEKIYHYFGLQQFEPLQNAFQHLLEPDKINVVIHPKSQGSSREWPIAHFIALINMLPQNAYNVFLTGVQKEKPFVEEIMRGLTRPVTNLSGKLSLDQFISFLKQCDAIVANATGPLHVGAALGINALGLYPPMRPIQPERWAPIGPKAQVFALNKNCSECKKTKHFCPCINAIEPLSIKLALDRIENASTKFSV